MDKRVSGLLGLALAAAIGGCKPTVGGISPGEPGDGEIKTEKRTIGSFQKIEVSDAFVVNVHAGKVGDISIQADANLMQYIKTSDNGEVLRIEAARTLKPTKPIVIDIPIEDLQGVFASGATKVTVQNIAANSLYEIRANGASKVNHLGSVEEVSVVAHGASVVVVSDVQGGPISVDADGSSRVNLAGRSQTAVLQADGSSVVLLPNIKLTQVIATALGASTIEVHVSEKLEASANGASKIVFAGNPKAVSKDVNGAAQVLPKAEA